MTICNSLWCPSKMLFFTDPTPVFYSSISKDTSCNFTLTAAFCKNCSSMGQQMSNKREMQRKYLVKKDNRINHWT